MIELTRLRHGESFLINPDLLERIDSQFDTVVRLTNGHEYVVSESAAEILERIMLFRARVLATGLTFQDAGIKASYNNSRHELGPANELLTAPPDGQLQDLPAPAPGHSTPGHSSPEPLLPEPLLPEPLLPEPVLPEQPVPEHVEDNTP